MIRSSLLFVVVLTTCAALLSSAAPTQAQVPAYPYPGANPVNSQPPGPGAFYGSYWYYPRWDVTQFSTLHSTNIWVPAYQLSPYQTGSWNYWYRTVYVPYMRATGYALPVQP